MSENRGHAMHHVTAIASDPQRNLDFYAGVLGLRLVKRTVNFDDPGTYHFYFGDRVGSPGSIVTFFPHLHADRGARGVGQVTEIALAIPAGSMADWAARLTRNGTDVEGPVERFGAETLVFKDPDGLNLAMVEAGGSPAENAWTGSVDAALAIGGVHGVTLSVAALEPTIEVLEETLGFARAGREANRHRFAAQAPDDAIGDIVDVLVDSSAPPGRIAAGSVHHVAWRAADDDAQGAIRARVVEHGLRVTEVLDRRYFRSIYFREPGGVLFEVATDGPGFDRDETLDRLGDRLMLPPWLEPERAQIERALPPVVAITASAASRNPDSERGTNRSSQSRPVLRTTDDLRAGSR